VIRVRPQKPAAHAELFAGDVDDRLRGSPLRDSSKIAPALAFCARSRALASICIDRD
jgi:hypothetical protein